MSLRKALYGETYAAKAIAAAVKYGRFMHEGRGILVTRAQLRNAHGLVLHQVNQNDIWMSTEHIDTLISDMQYMQLILRRRKDDSWKDAQLAAHVGNAQRYHELALSSSKTATETSADNLVPRKESASYKDLVVKEQANYRQRAQRHLEKAGEADGKLHELTGWLDDIIQNRAAFFIRQGD